MAVPVGLNTSTLVSQRQYENNMSQAGLHTQTVKNKATEPQSTESQVPLAGDSVSFTQDAAENATHVGVSAFQESADEQTDNVEMSSNGQETAQTSGTPAQSSPSESSSEPVYLGDPEQGYSPYVGDGGSNVPPNGTDAAGNANAEPNDEETGKTEGPQRKSATEQAQEAQKLQQERDEVNKILMQMHADRQKWFAELWKIIQDTQNAIYSIIGEAIANKADTFNKTSRMWSDAFRGR